MTHPETKTIRSFSAYVKYVETNCVSETVLFRGQREDKPLLPKIARIPLNGSTTVIENKMFLDFKRKSIPYLEHQPTNPWDWLALMQHHGLATRLLDWSLNPLAGLWFATSKPANSNKHGVVWMFNPSRADFVDTTSSANPFEGKRTRVFQPNHVTRRIVSQSGWFTVHKLMEKSKNFVALENNASYKKALTKLIIPPNTFSEMRYQLDRFGINSSSLFPGLDGLCNNIQWLHSTLGDEDEPSKGEHLKRTNLPGLSKRTQKKRRSR